MTEKPIATECGTQLIQQIRLMLCKGCTPLHIIQHLSNRFHGAGRWQSFVTDCFRQAFGVTLLSLPDRYESLLASHKVQDYLNTEILHEMISNRHVWMAMDRERDGCDSWLDDVNTTDIWTATDQFDPQAIPEIAVCWPHLDGAARQYIRMTIVNSKAHYERSLI